MSEKPNSQIKKRFNKKNMEIVERCEDRQTHLRSSRQYTKTEKSALSIDSSEAFSKFWATALSDKRTFDEKHQHGRSRIGKQVTSFSASAHDIIKNFDPLMSIVKDFGAPYGGMAIGTICFLLTVAKNRSKIEKQVNDTLISIQDRLPGVKMYRHIYDDDDSELGRQLQSKIVEAYDNFITFCIEASEFFSRRAIDRWMHALWNSSYLGAKVESVQQAVVEVRRVSEELLVQNVAYLKTINLELRDRLDQETLEKIRIDLGLEAYSAEKHQAQLSKHTADVEAEFGRYYEFDLPPHKVVYNDPEFQKWQSSKTSRLLLLSGLNDVPDAPHCWISPVALDMITDLTTTTIASKKAPDLCIFHLFGMGDEDEPYTQILVFFIHRLLCCNKPALHDQSLYDELKAELSAYLNHTNRQGRSNHGAEDLLEAILVRVLSSINANQTVWFILDRVDKCQTAADSKMHRRSLLRTLSRVIERSTVRLMILAVVNARDWNVEEFMYEIKGEGSEPGTMLLKYNEDESACT